MKPASRVNSIQEYYFSRKLKEVAKLNAEGQDIISLAIGSPDMPPSKQTIDKLCEVAHDPNAHGYQPTSGLPELHKAMAGFYKRTYGGSRPHDGGSADHWFEGRYHVRHACFLQPR